MHHMQFAVFKDVNEEQLGIWESLGSMIIWGHTTSGKYT
jgi:hypothetical protein